jgi:hypothetical protein
MDDEKPPQDSDPSGMTDFEENTTTHELQDAVNSTGGSDRERDNRTPNEQSRPGETT